jgi:transcriptional regulator with XRE-family HTH domain
MNKKHPNKEYKMKVGDNILHWRKLKGIKQDDLAERIGVSTSTLSNIENGVLKPDTNRLEDIADALEIEVSQLFINPKQLIITENSSAQGSLHSTERQQHFDKDLLERVVSVMEKIAAYFTSNGHKKPS